MFLLGASTVNLDSIIQLTSRIYAFSIVMINFSQQKKKNRYW